MHLDEGEDILLGQLVWVLGLLGVMHTDAVPPLPKEPAIVADAGKEKGGQRTALRRCRAERPPPHPLATVAYGNGPQPFRHQGLVS